MNRKESKLLLLALAFTMALVPAVLVKAKPLTGAMALYNPASGPPSPVPGGVICWSGTISGDINGNMYFYNTWSKDVGWAHFFEEVWLITDGNGDTLLMGTDHGVVSKKNLKYRMNGVVTAAGLGFESLIGHRVHMSGIIIKVDGIPVAAPGTFRVN